MFAAKLGHCHSVQTVACQKAKLKKIVAGQVSCEAYVAVALFLLHANLIVQCYRPSGLRGVRGGSSVPAVGWPQHLHCAGLQDQHARHGTGVLRYQQKYYFIAELGTRDNSHDNLIKFVRPKKCLSSSQFLSIIIILCNHLFYHDPH